MSKPGPERKKRKQRRLARETKRAASARERWMEAEGTTEGEEERETRAQMWKMGWEKGKEERRR